MTDRQRDFDAGSQMTGSGPRDDFPFPRESWHRVSLKYAYLHTVFSILFVIALGVALLLVNVNVFGAKNPVPQLIGWALIGLSPVYGLLVFRYTKSIGYQLRTDDFIYRRGLFINRTIAVPYGRLQLVDVQQGPILRIFKLASLKFITAAVGSNVTLPGIDKAVADRLRDELIRVAETRRSGL